MTGVRGRDKTPGEFRRNQVHIGSDRRFIPPPSNNLNQCLRSFEKYIHQPYERDPLVECFLLHYQFQAIHPFMDGNGRVGRLLLALMIHVSCGFTRPWLYMSAFFDKHKDEYIDRLFRVSTHADWTGWIGFCLRGTIEQSQDTAHRCHGLLALRNEYHTAVQEHGGSVRLARIVDRLFEYPVVEVAALAREHGVTYPTGKADVERLVEAGVLVELAETRQRTFYAPRIFEVVHHEN